MKIITCCLAGVLFCGFSGNSHAECTSYSENYGEVAELSVHHATTGSDQTGVYFNLRGGLSNALNGNAYYMFRPGGKASKQATYQSMYDLLVKAAENDWTVKVMTLNCEYNQELNATKVASILVGIPDKQGEAFCTAAESDARTITADIADYFAIPSHTTLGTTPIVLDPAGGPPASGGVEDMTFHALSGSNTAVIEGDIRNMTIKVSDNSGRCPVEYQEAHDGWNGTGVYTITM